MSVLVVMNSFALPKKWLAFATGSIRQCTMTFAIRRFISRGFLLGKLGKVGVHIHQPLTYTIGRLLNFSTKKVTYCRLSAIAISGNVLLSKPSRGNSRYEI